jgi:phage regulator Rha-like protein
MSRITIKDLQTFKIESMSSLEIAELTGKSHYHVTRDIKKILEEVEIDPSKFKGIYKDSYGRNQVKYDLPKRECLLVVSGYSAKMRLDIIDELQYKQLEQGV